MLNSRAIARIFLLIMSLGRSRGNPVPDVLVRRERREVVRELGQVSYEAIRSLHGGGIFAVQADLSFDL